MSSSLQFFCRRFCLAAALFALELNAVELPPLFSHGTIATGLASPTAMAIAPDGRIFVALQNGTVRVLKNDALLETPFVSLAVNAEGERGLLGITVDPDFATNGYVYVYYTAVSPVIHNRISRLTAIGDVAASGSEVALLDLPDLFGATIHMGGALHFGPDGKLYIAVGDNLSPGSAPALNDVRGKILRVNSDGTIPEDNPFYAQTSGQPRAIWSRGLRNPFTMAFQPGSGRFFINDVGQADWEEINLGAAGANYGWPSTEGDFDPALYPDFRRPVHAYSHEEGCSIGGGVFYNPVGEQFPPAFAGKYFFADFCGGWIRMLDPETQAVEEFASGLVFPVDLRVNSAGALYYLARGNAGAVGKIEYNVAGPPIITLHPQSQTIGNGRPVEFEASAISASALSYQWRRNGADLPGATASSYSIPQVAQEDNGAEFSVVITNANGSAISNVAVLTVPPGDPPEAIINEPVAGARYNAGDEIFAAGTGTDPDDGPLPATAFTWRVDFHHLDHVHPFVPPTSGTASINFQIPTTSHGDGQTWHRIHLTVEDSTGLTTTAFRDIFPNVSTTTFLSDPPGLQIKIDGQPQTTPFAIESVVGTRRSLEAFDQGSGITSYEFQSWSDGGPAAHEITVLAAATTYTATFQPAAATFLSDLNWIETPVNGWGPPERDRSNGETGANDGGPITLNGATYVKGLGVHAHSELIYALDGNYSRFISDLGIDNEVGGNGSVVFEVWLDGVREFESAVLTGGAGTQRINLSVVNKNTLRLVVRDAGNGNGFDHADWAGARLLRPTVSVTATDSSASEWNTLDTGAFTLRRTGPALGDLAVSYTLAGTATAGSDYAALSGSIIIPDGAAQTLLAILPSADDEPEGSENVALTLAPSTRYATASSSAATVVILDEPGDAWRYDHFGPAASTPAAADAADPDADGLANLLERLFNLDPNESSAAGVTLAMVDGRLQIEFIRDTEAIDVRCDVMGSSDLETWEPIASSVGGAPFSGSAFSIVETGDGRYRAVTVTDQVAPDAGTPSRFLRIEVTPLAAPP